MTRLPLEDRAVFGQPGYEPELEEVCFHPHCDVRGRENLERHECWPRSFLRNQPICWVALPDGRRIPNQVYLCNSFKNKHHWMITTNRARLIYDERTRRYEWCEALKNQP